MKGAREAKEPRESDAGFGFSALLAPTYSSNVYREQRRREADFDQNAPGERYYEMEGPADVGTELGVQGSYRWRLDGTRDARVLLGASYVFYVRNGIANYFSALGSVGYELGSRDRLSLRADVVPRRFKKNYSIREVDGNKFYEHAYYWQIEASPAWRHKWTKRGKTELGYELGVRRYLSPFENRDTTRHGAELLGSYDFGRVEPTLGARAAIGITPSGLEFGTPVDRSYREVEPLAAVDVTLGSGFSVGADVEYRIRHYTTDDPANETYFDRTDRRWTLGVGAKKRFGSTLAFTVNAGWLQNETNRSDHPDVDPEDLGYEEALLGLGVEATL